MSRASRSATPERAARAPQSPLSVSSGSPRARPPLDGDRTPPNPASAEDECCCVCLERLRAAAPADQLPVPFPTCRRHRMHLGCLAQYCAQATCVPLPERIAGKSTVCEAVRDYALRTFTSNDAPEPRPPAGVTLLCCHRVAAVGGSAGVNFVHIPDREMQWAPSVSPPRGLHPTWLYVPLLHAAAGDMPPDLLQQWRTRAAWWEDARRTLAASHPIRAWQTSDAFRRAAPPESRAPPERGAAACLGRAPDPHPVDPSVPAAVGGAPAQAARSTNPPSPPARRSGSHDSHTPAEDIPAAAPSAVSVMTNFLQPPRSESVLPGQAAAMDVAGGVADVDAILEGSWWLVIIF
eukprot:s721_g24.t1